MLSWIDICKVRHGSKDKDKDKGIGERHKRTIVLQQFRDGNLCFQITLFQTPVMFNNNTHHDDKSTRQEQDKTATSQRQGKTRHDHDTTRRDTTRHD